MADKIIEELVSRIEALEKKYCEVNFPYQKPPYPCVVEMTESYYPSNRSSRNAFLLSDGQIKIVDDYCWGRGENGTIPTTLAQMAERAGIEIAPADMKKKTVVTPMIFKKFGGMRFAYMGEFMVSNSGNLYIILPDTVSQVLDDIEMETAELGYPFKREPSVSEWDNLKAAIKALKIAKDKSRNATNS